MMTVSRTPIRVSFFGGGTDYREYFERMPGSVVGTTINKYIYIVTLPMVGFAETRFRLTYSKVETVNEISEIQHPVVRVVMTEQQFNDPINIAIISDMPGGTGLGSSSAFTVGFVNLINRLKGVSVTKYDLARSAIHVEQDLLKENVGVQDQIHAAFGGLSKYNFHKKEFNISPIRMTTGCRQALNQSMLLVHTGVTRHASKILDSQVKKTTEKTIDKDLSHLYALAEQGVAVLEQTSTDGMLKDMGKMLNDGWLTKRSLSSGVSTPQIDEIYDASMAAGAYGGKLCGAGGGGFFLFLAPPDAQKKIIEKFGDKNVIKIEMEDAGSQIMLSS